MLRSRPISGGSSSDPLKIKRFQFQQKSQALGSFGGQNISQMNSKHNISLNHQNWKSYNLTYIFPSELSRRPENKRLRLRNTGFKLISVHIIPVKVYHVESCKQNLSWFKFWQIWHTKKNCDIRFRPGLFEYLTSSMISIEI